MSPAAADDASRWICSGGPLEWPGHPVGSLSQALHRAIASGNRTIDHISNQGHVSRRTYAELLRDAHRVACGLLASDLEPGQVVLLQLREPAQYLLGLWGCVLADLIPAPMSVPPTYRGQAPAQRRLKDAWHLLKHPPILTDASMATEFARLAGDDSHFPAPNNVLDLVQVAGSRAEHRGEPLRGGDDVAIILLTSGSSGEPKGVMLSHRNLLSMAAGTAQQNRLDHRDVTLNWLPLDHVGAVSFLHLMPTLLGCQQVHVATDYVLRDLLVWIDLLDQYRATISWAPNFAFRLISQRAGEIETRSWDLSPIRFLVNAGEAVVPETVRDFWQQLEPFGLRLEAIRPAFGMSETCSGITWSPGMTPEQLDATDRHVDLGPPIPGASLRIADADGRPLPEGHEGRLQIRAASLFLGYANRPDLSRQAFTPDGWFDTGDLGTLRDGHLTITGRAKEVIIINGVHYASQQIEAAVDALPGVATSYTAACAVRPPGSDTDRLAVFFCPTAAGEQPATGRSNADVRSHAPSASPRQTKLSEKSTSIGSSDADAHARRVGWNAEGPEMADLIGEVRRAVIDRVGIAPDFIIPLAQHDVPKTGIGKIQRSRLKEQFERGEIGRGRIDRRTARRDSAAPSSAASAASLDSESHRARLLATDTQQLASPPHRPAISNRSAAGDLREQVIALWQQVLETDQIGPDDSFFELGGRSIDLPRLEAALKKHFDIDATSADLLAYPTPTALAEWIAHRTSPAAVQGQSAAGTHGSPRVAPARESVAARPVADQPVAIIGMACRFPGANDVEQFWHNLREGRETIRKLDPQELLDQGVPAELLRDPNYVPAVPWIEGIDRFDASFFGYDDDQAAMIDPQQRLFLQCAWHALEDSGTDPSRFSGRIGVFGSAGLNMYMNHVGLVPELTGDFQEALTSGAVDFLATRAAYKLNLTGPSLTVQTACSSGLYAVHLACRSLAEGECEMALAGGASIWALEPRGYRYREGGLASPDGHCRAFDARGRGMVFGNGVGLVVLKPLAAALRDGNPIHAVIRASAVNNDGALKAGFTATGMQGQADVVARACQRAGVDPATIGLVECHGTGTVLGDAIEIAGLTHAFRRWTDKRAYCAIGSVKTNIGHMGVACGIAGLIKATLAVEHAELPPSLHFENPNPQIDFASSPFFVNTQRLAWPETLSPRRAGVTSLGLGGANVHVIIEQPPESSPAARRLAPTGGRSRHDEFAGQDRSASHAITARSDSQSASRSSPAGPPSAAGEPQLLVVSAKSPAALQRATSRLADFLQRSPHVDLVDVSYTLQHGRQAMPYRTYVVAHDAAAAAAALRRYASHFSPNDSAAQPIGQPSNDSAPSTSIGLLAPARHKASRPRWVLALGSPAALQPADVANLYAQYPLFQETVDRLAAKLRADVKQQVVRWLQREDDLHRSHDTAARLAQENDGFEDDRALPTSGMSPVHQETVQAASNGSPPREPIAQLFQCALAQVWLQCINEPPVGVVVSGDEGSAAVVAALSETFDLAAWINQRYTNSATGRSRSEPSRSKWPHITDNELPAFLASHSPCHVVQVIAVAENSPASATVARPTVSGDGSPAVEDALERRPPLECCSPAGLLDAIGRCWVAGLPIHWDAVGANRRGRLVRLPGYPFEPRRCWIDRPSSSRVATVPLLATNSLAPRTTNAPSTGTAIEQAPQTAPGAQSTASSTPSADTLDHPVTHAGDHASGSTSGIRSEVPAPHDTPNTPGDASLVDDIARLADLDVLRALRETDHSEEPGP